MRIWALIPLDDEDEEERLVEQGKDSSDEGDSEDDKASQVMEKRFGVLDKAKDEDEHTFRNPMLLATLTNHSRGVNCVRSSFFFVFFFLFCCSLFLYSLFSFFFLLFSFKDGVPMGTVSLLQLMIKLFFCGAWREELQRFLVKKTSKTGLP